LGIHWVVVSDLDAVKTIQRDRTHYPNTGIFRKALTHTMGPSMFSSEGEIWDQKHKILSPVMSTAMMNHSTTVLHEKAQLFLDRLQQELNHGEIEIVWLIKRLVMDLIGEIAFGINFASLSNNQQTVIAYSSLILHCDFSQFKPRYLDSSLKG
jgi:cytochrome P450